MIIKHSTSTITSNKSNICNPGGKSFTDKSKFRPDSVNLRDKAIAINKNGGGMVGLYDENVDVNTAKALSYARKPGRDITEIETAKSIIEKNIEISKAQDKEKLKKTENAKAMAETFKNIEKNTAPKEEE